MKSNAPNNKITNPQKIAAAPPTIEKISASYETLAAQTRLLRGALATVQYTWPEYKRSTDSFDTQNEAGHFFHYFANKLSGIFFLTHISQNTPIQEQEENLRDFSTKMRAERDRFQKLKKQIEDSETSEQFPAPDKKTALALLDKMEAQTFALCDSIDAAFAKNKVPTMKAAPKTRG